MPLKPGMRVLDLGCGRAKSSVFLAREFGVQVTAVDLMITATENLQRIRQAGLEGQITPLQCDARALPFAAEAFDAIIAIDSFFYFGTDALYLNYLANFVREGGWIGMAGASARTSSRRWRLPMAGISLAKRRLTSSRRNE